MEEFRPTPKEIVEEMGREQFRSMEEEDDDIRLPQWFVGVIVLMLLVGLSFGGFWCMSRLGGD